MLPPKPLVVIYGPDSKLREARMEVANHINAEFRLVSTRVFRGATEKDADIVLMIGELPVVRKAYENLGYRVEAVTLNYVPPTLSEIKNIKHFHTRAKIIQDLCGKSMPPQNGLEERAALIKYFGLEKVVNEWDDPQYPEEDRETVTDANG